MRWGSLPAGDRAERGRLARRYLMIIILDDGDTSDGRLLAIGHHLMPEAEALAVSNSHPAILVPSRIAPSPTIGGHSSGPRRRQRPLLRPIEDLLRPDPLGGD